MYVSVMVCAFLMFTIQLEQIGIEISAKLSTTLKRIEDTLILSPQVTICTHVCELNNLHYFIFKFNSRYKVILMITMCC